MAANEGPSSTSAAASSRAGWLNPRRPRKSWTSQAIAPSQRMAGTRMRLVNVSPVAWARLARGTMSAKKPGG